MFAYVRGFLLLLFLPSVLKVDRRGWVLLFIDFDPLEKREEPSSLDMLYTFSCFSICARGACPQGRKGKKCRERVNGLRREYGLQMGKDTSSSASLLTRDGETA